MKVDLTLWKKIYGEDLTEYYMTISAKTHVVDLNTANAVASKLPKSYLKIIGKSLSFQ